MLQEMPHKRRVASVEVKRCISSINKKKGNAHNCHKDAPISTTDQKKYQYSERLGGSHSPMSIESKGLLTPPAPRFRTWVYTIVVFTSLCPSSSCTVRMS